ncbi:MAG: SAM-dependent methyltransferase [Eubacterium sp.]|jgi:tRNA (adenine22-N1)-methyltransferase|nr:SAM-dependent methyltransferase [Eubacterium sp.]
MLSKRLKAVADMVTEGNIAADIGTDHGYVPIYLIKNNISKKAYALDINEGPLKMAAKNIRLEGLSDKITTVLSDGMEQMKDNMAESVIIAGMGGDLIVDILSRGSRIKGIKELVLSPHKRIDLVRKFLSQNCWEIIKEDMVMDGGKYYTIIKAVKGQNTEYTDVELLYGKYLLETKNQVLKQYLKKENEKFSKILNTMKESGNVNDFQIKEVLKMNQKGRAYYD